MEWLAALVVGLVQGLLEWLPVSSEGAVALALTALDAAPGAATRLALFLHAGTAVAAAVYYRGVLAEFAGLVRSWRPGSAFAGETADLSFFLLATLVSGLTGVAGFAVLEEVTTAVTGGAFVALVGALLVGTGLFMYAARSRAREFRESPGAVDAVLVGALQGLAVLPGVSRSGTTVSALLLRGHDGPAALELSFVLSIPAAMGAGGIALVESGGSLEVIAPDEAVLALVASAVVGYLTVDALTRVVERIAFWRVCVGFGTVAVAGGGLLVL
ncbi:MAG: undecaprenyl-diphosphate phosphatase [Salinirussus sp.]